HRSGGRLRKPRHDVQQCRFAAARRADQGDEFALADRKANVAKRRAAVRRESLFEAIDQKGISHLRRRDCAFDGITSARLKPLTRPKSICKRLPYPPSAPEVPTQSA